MMKKKKKTQPDEDLVIIDPEEEEEVSPEPVEKVKPGQDKLSPEFENLFKDLVRRKITAGQINKIAKHFGLKFKPDQQGGSRADKLRFIVSNGGEGAGDFILDLEGNSKADFNEKIDALAGEPKKKKKERKSKRKSKVVVIPDN